MFKTYSVMFGLGANDAFGSNQLPNELLVDGAANFLGAHYAQRLQQDVICLAWALPMTWALTTRSACCAHTFFAQRHPLARHAHAAQPLHAH